MMHFFSTYHVEQSIVFNSSTVVVHCADG